ncbi:hypothetical protein [Methylococcus sp. Mc7]|uniref:hypothetical protein n=1 Tax=Methylococcus sp. Mc7 TaxID=2860258 RepID=UPI001C5314B9|nr:hypothetical protein [Methylococcus sp. Mc7]QXP83785.1 hypothetical protein KW115_16835 [Methylococcus sp. Mc7]
MVIADEAHRSQYGFKAKVASQTGEIAYGFAKYLRDALPNASFIGFTGTPIEATDVNTPAVFGHYIDIYDISRAVEDGATVPIYYESRLARIELDEDEKPRIDAEIEALLEDEDEPSAERTKQKWSTVEALVGSDKRLALVAADLVQHFEDRVAALEGKAMMVCMSRRICVALHDEIIKLRPDWHSEDDNAGSIKIVMTGAASDPVEWQQHIGNKARRDLLAKRARDPRRPLAAGDRTRHVADRLRRPLHAHHVHRQTHARARPDAGHRPGQPGVPRQAGRPDRGLHRHRPEPEIGARAVLQARPGQDRHRRA